MLSEKQLIRFNNIPEEMKSLSNWVLSTNPKVVKNSRTGKEELKGKMPLNVNFLRFTDTIKDLGSQTKLLQVYDFIKSNDLTPKLDNKQQSTDKVYMDLSSYDTFIEDLSNNVSSKPEDTFYNRLYEKICYKLNGASATNPKTFTTFTDALDFLQSDSPLITKLDINTNAMGFELIGTNIFCIDIDKGKDLGYIDKDTYSYVKDFATYTELSQSGLGVHIFGIGNKRLDKCKNIDLGIEIYDSQRYIAMTGDILTLPNLVKYTTLENRQDILASYEESVFKKELDKLTKKAKKTNQVTDTNNVVNPEEVSKPKSVKSNLTDKQVIDLVLQRDNDSKFRNAFYNGLLITGHYKDKIVEEDDSATDQMVCDRIAIITQDTEQIKRLWLKSEHTKLRTDSSKLYRFDYVNEDTIQKALDNAFKVIEKEKDFDSSLLNPEDEIFNPNPLDFANFLKGKVTDLIYIPEYDTKASYTGYFLYNGIVWNRLTTGQVIKYLGDYIFRNFSQYENLNNDFKKFFKTLKSTNGIKQVLTFLQADITIKNPNLFNQDKYKLCVTNGIVDLKTGQLLPFKKDYYFNTQLDITYKPDEVVDFSKCKFYDAFKNIFEVSKPTNPDNPEDLTTILDYEDTINTLNCIQKIFGYSLSGDISKHKIFIMVGKGRNGKSVLQKILLNILKDFGFTGQQDTVLLDRWGNNSKSHLMMDLKDKRTVFFNEFNPNQTLNVGRLKNLSGGDIITGDAKFVDTVNFYPTFKIFLTSNYIPTFDSSSSAITNRLIIIPFNNVFSDNEDAISKGAKPIIENLDTKLLEEEKDLIFKWMVKGSVDFFNNGMDFELSNIIKDKTKEVILEFNPLGEFLDLFLPSGRINKNQLWCLYNAFIGNNKVYKDKNTLTNALINSNWNNNSITKYKSDTRWLKGISINPNSEWIKNHLLLEDGKPIEDSQGNLQFTNLGGIENDN